MKRMKETIEILTQKTVLTPFLKGPHGIGKTTFVQDLAKEWGKTFVTMNLSACEAGDFQGLPFIKDGETHYAKPQFMNYDVIFLDEVDRVRDLSVKAALNSLLLDRSINGHELKKGAVVITAGNYDSDKYETGEFDPSLIDRLAVIDFKVTVAERIEFYKRVLGKDNVFIQFVETKPEIFNDFSPRRLHNAAKVYENDMALEVVIGKDMARTFFNFMHNGLVSLEDLLNGKSNFGIMSSLTRLNLMNAVLEEFSTLNIRNSIQIKNCNEFINKLSAEEKSLYFSKIRDMFINDKINKDMLLKLNELNMFKDQKQYLKELSNSN